MLVSWRHILQQARSNLGQDTKNYSRSGHYRSERDGSPWGYGEPDPMREGRELLSRELEARAAQRWNHEEAFSDESLHRPRLTRAVTPPALRRQSELSPPTPPPYPSKISWWRNLAVVSSSGMVLSVAAYMLLHQGETSALLSGEAAASRPSADEALDDAPPPPVTQTLALAVVSSDAQLPVQAARHEEPIEPRVESDRDLEVEEAPPAPANTVLSREVTKPAMEVTKPAVQDSVKVAALSPQKAPPPPVATSTLSRATEDALLERASVQLKLGDIAGARSIFEVLAQYGSQLGALGAAETYDPNILSGRLITGLKPDTHMARTWYEKAAQLGNEDAPLRLKALESSAN